MATTLETLARLVGGRVAGAPQTPVCGAAILRDVTTGEITFIDSAEKLPALLASNASAAVVPLGVAADDMPVVQVAHVPQAFAAIVTHFRPRRAAQPAGISPAAHVSGSAKISSGVTIYPGATIGDEVEIGPRTVIHAGVHVQAGCIIGENVTIYPGAILYEDTMVGPRSIIHGGAVLGADGFGYSTEQGRHKLSAQLGYVELASDVEIGAGTTIDRGTYGPTYIGEGTKIDDQVQIAHNCRIGRHNLICAQVGIAGSTTTGDYVVIAGQAGIRDHVHIGDRAMLSAMAGIINDVAAGERMMGIPATPEREQKLKQAAFSKLPEMRRQLKQLQKTIAGLEARLDGGEQKQAA